MRKGEVHSYKGCSILRQGEIHSYERCLTLRQGSSGPQGRCLGAAKAAPKDLGSSLTLLSFKLIP